VTPIEKLRKHKHHVISLIDKNKKSIINVKNFGSVAKREDK
jgi:hypothetical protein